MAHLWEAPPPPSESQLQAASAHGVPREALLSAYEPPEPFGVWPENWPGLQLFMGMATQWRHSPMGGRTGIDYVAVPVVQRHLRQRGRVAREALAALQVLEAEWLQRERARAEAAQ